MIRLNLFMIWFLHFLSLLSVICMYYRQNSSSRIIVILVYTVSTLFLYSNVTYLFRRCLEVAEAFKIFKTMEKKNRNEELQSRREFFKKAAKGVLPILGATLLANTPLLVKATEEDPMGCNYSCSYSCSNSCSGSCYGGCKGGCGGACSYSCQNTCKGSCQGSCRGGCSSMSSF